MQEKRISREQQQTEVSLAQPQYRIESEFPGNAA